VAALSDVENALVSLIVAAAYPGGTGSPSAVTSAVAVYRGWPVPSQLDSDLEAGTLNVSVWPGDTESRATRHVGREIELPAAPAGLTLTASNTTVTASGTVSSPLNAAILVDGKKAYVYAVQPGDTLAGIAAGLASLVNIDTPATSTGPVVTIPAAKSLVARVGGFGSTVREVKRQKRQFQVTLWCPDPASRDALGECIESALADVTDLSLPDGTAGRLLYERSRVSDRAERDGLYRRDLFYSVEYSTTKSDSAAQVVAELLDVTSPDGTPLSSTAT
jgi:hypothetical protein